MAIIESSGLTGSLSSLVSVFADRSPSDEIALPLEERSVPSALPRSHPHLQASGGTILVQRAHSHVQATPWPQDVPFDPIAPTL